MTFLKGHNTLLKGPPLRIEEGVCGLLLFTCYLFELSAFLTVSTVSFLSFKTKGNTNVEGLGDGSGQCPC